MRIPITMCHGIRPTAAGALRNPLTEERFDTLMRAAAEMGFQSINYDQLAAWRQGTSSLPERPIMIDFDHPVVSMRREVFLTLERYGFKGNLFIYTSPYDPDYPRPLALAQIPEHMPGPKYGNFATSAGISAPTPSAIPTCPTWPRRTRRERCCVRSWTGATG